MFDFVQYSTNFRGYDVSSVVLLFNQDGTEISGHRIICTSTIWAVQQ
jgi:hypothetical protein